MVRRSRYDIRRLVLVADVQKSVREHVRLQSDDGDAAAAEALWAGVEGDNDLNKNGRILALLAEAKKLAQEYRTLTRKPLGITGEVAEYEAARLLGVELTSARQAGYDAIRTSDGRRYQIKGRCLLPGGKPGQRLRSIRIEKEFDAVLMVLLDEHFDTLEIYEADRQAVIAALSRPGSRARNERGALAVSKFKSVGHLVWQRPA